MTDGSERPDPPPRPETAVFDVAIRLGFLALCVYMSFTLALPFLPLIAWSIILAVAFYPLFDWLRARLGGRGRIAAAAVTLLCLATVFGPAAILGASAVSSLEGLAAQVMAGTFSIPQPPEALKTLPVIGDGLDTFWTTATSNFSGFIDSYGHVMLLPGEWLLKAAAGFAGSLLVFAASVVVAGFLFVPAPRLDERIRAISMRVAGPRGSGFVTLAGATIRNVARGVIGVSALQALLIGIGLIVAGVPHAGLLSLAAFILATAQLGSALVVIPVVIWFWLTHDTMPAVFLTAYLLAAGAIEHPLKPIVMGKGLETPMPVILVGILGGTIAYGLPGLFIGPTVLAVAYDLFIYWSLPARESDRQAQTNPDA